MLRNSVLASCFAPAAFQYGPQFSGAHEIWPISAEFLHFQLVLRNAVLASDKWTNMAYFGWVQAALEN